MMIVNFAAAAVTAVLAVSSGQNMLQTLQASRKDDNSNNNPRTLIGAGKLIRPSETTDEVVAQIQSLKRHELLEIYFSSKAPKDLSEIEGQWDGCLLDNNSWIMVRKMIEVTFKNGFLFFIPNENHLIIYSPVYRRV